MTEPFQQKRQNFIQALLPTLLMFLQSHINAAPQNLIRSITLPVACDGLKAGTEIDPAMNFTYSYWGHSIDQSNPPKVLTRFSSDLKQMEHRLELSNFVVKAIAPKNDRRHVFVIGIQENTEKALMYDYYSDSFVWLEPFEDKLTPIVSPGTSKILIFACQQNQQNSLISLRYDTQSKIAHFEIRNSFNHQIIAKKTFSNIQIDAVNYSDQANFVYLLVVESGTPSRSVRVLNFHDPTNIIMVIDPNIKVDQMDSNQLQFHMNTFVVRSPSLNLINQEQYKNGSYITHLTRDIYSQTHKNMYSLPHSNDHPIFLFGSSGNGDSKSVVLISNMTNHHTSTSVFIELEDIPHSTQAIATHRQSDDFVVCLQNKKIQLYSICHQTCKTCFGIGANQCLSCNGRYKKNQNNYCVCDQPGNFLLGPECQSCHENCISCASEAEDSCSACKDGFYLFESRCKDSCPAEYYKDDKTKKCLPCEEPCKECTSQKDCTVCTKPYMSLDKERCYDCVNQYDTVKDKCFSDQKRHIFSVDITKQENTKSKKTDDSFNLKFALQNYDKLKPLLQNFVKFDDIYELKFEGVDSSAYDYRYYYDDPAKAIMLGVNVTSSISGVNLKIYVKKPQLFSTGSKRQLTRQLQNIKEGEEIVFANKTQIIVISASPPISASQSAQVESVASSVQGAVNGAVTAGFSAATASSFFSMGMGSFFIKFFQVMDIMSRFAMINIRFGPILQNLLEGINADQELPFPLPEEIFGDDTEKYFTLVKTSGKITEMGEPISVLAQAPIFIILYFVSWVLYLTFLGIYKLRRTKLRALNLEEKEFQKRIRCITKAAAFFADFKFMSWGMALLDVEFYAMNTIANQYIYGEMSGRATFNYFLNIVLLVLCTYDIILLLQKNFDLKNDYNEEDEKLKEKIEKDNDILEDQQTKIGKTDDTAYLKNQTTKVCQENSNKQNQIQNLISTENKVTLNVKKSGKGARNTHVKEDDLKTKRRESIKQMINLANPDESAAALMDQSLDQSLDKSQEISQQNKIIEEKNISKVCQLQPQSKIIKKGAQQDIQKDLTKLSKEDLQTYLDNLNADNTEIKKKNKVDSEKFPDYRGQGMVDFITAEVEKRYMSNIYCRYANSSFMLRLYLFQIPLVSLQHYPTVQLFIVYGINLAYTWFIFKGIFTVGYMEGKMSTIHKLFLECSIFVFLTFCFAFYTDPDGTKYSDQTQLYLQMTAIAIVLLSVIAEFIYVIYGMIISLIAMIKSAIQSCKRKRRQQKRDKLQNELLQAIKEAEERQAEIKRIEEEKRRQEQEEIDRLKRFQEEKEQEEEERKRLIAEFGEYRLYDGKADPSVLMHSIFQSQLQKKHKFRVKKVRDQKADHKSFLAGLMKQGAKNLKDQDEELDDFEELHEDFTDAHFNSKKYDYAKRNEDFVVD